LRASGGGIWRPDRTQYAIVEANKAQGGSEPGIGDLAAMAARDALDHAMETRAAQLIADGAGWEGIG
jgi:hypothetical protein